MLYNGMHLNTGNYDIRHFSGKRRKEGREINPSFFFDSTEFPILH